MPTSKQIELESRLLQIRREGEERDARRRGASLKIPYINLSQTPVSVEAIKLLPEKTARQSAAAVIQKKDGNIALAAADPNSEDVKKIISSLEAEKYTVHKFLISRSSLEEVWKMYEFIPPEPEHITGDIIINEENYAAFIKKYSQLSDIISDLAGQNFEHVQTSSLFQLILIGAVAVGASDIHLESEEKAAKLRYRVDGVLHDIVELPRHNWGNIVTRIKLLSQLKINIREEAQDGRFAIKLAKKEIEIRVSIIPAQFGETIVMRLLDPDSINVGLEELGLRSDDFDLLKEFLNRPNGLILNTGPTGSGKTTTLYACLKFVATPEVKIITVEDPIEYRLDGIEQTQVEAKVGYTFASGLRSILRQDPDIILVGEVRDGETADIALQAALTGHLVFSTLHTNSAVGAVPRLVDLGVKPQTVSPALSLVIAQRLVRKLCEYCRKPVGTGGEKIENLKKFINGLPARLDKKKYLSALDENKYEFAPAGCPKCSGLGYKGRIGIFEFFKIDDEAQEAILTGVSEISMRRLAEKQEMVSMQKDGLLKVILGLTSFEEIRGATGQINWEKL